MSYPCTTRVFPERTLNVNSQKTQRYFNEGHLAAVPNSAGKCLPLAAGAAGVIYECIFFQLPIGGSVLHLFSSRSVLSTSGENASLMLNSFRISSGVLSVACERAWEWGGDRGRGGYPIEKEASAEFPISFGACIQKKITRLAAVQGDFVLVVNRGRGGSLHIFLLRHRCFSSRSYMNPHHTQVNTYREALARLRH